MADLPREVANRSLDHRKSTPDKGSSVPTGALPRHSGSPVTTPTVFENPNCSRAVCPTPGTSLPAAVRPQNDENRPQQAGFEFRLALKCLLKSPWRRERDSNPRWLITTAVFKLGDLWLSRSGSRRREFGSVQARPPLTELVCSEWHTNRTRSGRAVLDQGADLGISSSAEGGSGRYITNRPELNAGHRVHGLLRGAGVAVSIAVDVVWPPPGSPSGSCCTFSTPYGVCGRERLLGQAVQLSTSTPHSVPCRTGLTISSGTPDCNSSPGR